MPAPINEHGHSTANAFLFGRGHDRNEEEGRMTQAEMYEAIDLICDHLGISIHRWHQEIQLANHN